jgi:hypothetical protein
VSPVASDLLSADWIIWVGAAVLALTFVFVSVKVETPQRSKGGRHTSSARPTRRPSSPPPSCGTCTPSSPPAGRGIRASPPTALGQSETPLSPPDHPVAAHQIGAGGGEPSPALRHTMISTLIMGSPPVASSTPITRCWAQPHHRYAGQTTDKAPTNP